MVLDAPKCILKIIKVLQWKSSMLICFMGYLYYFIVKKSEIHTWTLGLDFFADIIYNENYWYFE